ncbi:hypothetical protein [Microvirga sp. M2]|uniref:hypothetical protein n=1 Tax=Microvirga sp. M2 TaxID=3073270 RepID=UPI0039C43389
MLATDAGIPPLSALYRHFPAAFLLHPSDPRRHDQDLAEGRDPFSVMTALSAQAALRR